MPTETPTIFNVGEHDDVDMLYMCTLHYSLNNAAKFYVVATEGEKVMMVMEMVVINNKPSPKHSRPSMLNLLRMSNTTSSLCMGSRYPHIHMRKTRPSVSRC